MNLKSGFGLATIKQEGTPLNPYDAIMFDGPGATDEWFKRQCKAYFNFRRLEGATERELQVEFPEYYLPLEAR